MAKIKRHLSSQEEFDILKLVLDKFLWMGVIIMAYGFYRIVGTTANIWTSILILAAGVVLMLIFTWMLLREYHVMR
jgi:hypothetical protein